MGTRTACRCSSPGWCAGTIPAHDRNRRLRFRGATGCPSPPGPLPPQGHWPCRTGGPRGEGPRSRLAALESAPDAADQIRLFFRSAGGSGRRRGRGALLRTATVALTRTASFGGTLGLASTALLGTSARSFAGILAGGSLSGRFLSCSSLALSLALALGATVASARLRSLLRRGL